MRCCNRNRPTSVDSGGVYTGKTIKNDFGKHCTEVSTVQLCQMLIEILFLLQGELITVSSSQNEVIDLDVEYLKLGHTGTSGNISN